MTKYQLIYNGHENAVLCKTKAEAEKFKQKAAEQCPEMRVEIKAIEGRDNEN